MYAVTSALVHWIWHFLRKWCWDSTQKKCHGSVYHERACISSIMLFLVDSSEINSTSCFLLRKVLNVSHVIWCERKVTGENTAVIFHHDRSNYLLSCKICTCKFQINLSKLTNSINCKTGNLESPIETKHLFTSPKRYACKVHNVICQNCSNSLNTYYACTIYLAENEITRTP